MLSAYIIFLLAVHSIIEATIILHDRTVEFVQWKEVESLPNHTLSLVNQNYYNLTDKLVYMDYPVGGRHFGDLFIQKLNGFRKSGAIGILICRTDDKNRRRIGIGNYVGQSTAELNITAGFINLQTYEYLTSLLQNERSMVNVTFLYWDPNPWDAVFNDPWFILYRILLPLMFFCNMVLSVYKMIRWRTKQGSWRFGLGLVCLLLEFLSNSVLMAGGIVFPSYNIYMIGSNDSFQTIPTSLTLITGILVIFFWFDVTIDPFFHKKGKFLGIMKIPAIITICIIVILECISNIVRNLIQTSVVTFIIVFYMVFHLIISLFYFFASWKILSVDIKTDVRKKLTKITYRIILSGVAVLFLALDLGLLYSPASYEPAAFAVLWFFLHLCLYFHSLCLMNIFNIKSGKKVTLSSSPKVSQISSTSKSSSLNQTQSL